MCIRDRFIGGYVEDAVLKAGKDIIIKDGVNAKTNGYIEAGGNISARFFENARVISHGDIKCDYMLNTNATAYGNVYPVSYTHLCRSAFKTRDTADL